MALSKYLPVEFWNSSDCPTIAAIKKNAPRKEIVQVGSPIKGETIRCPRDLGGKVGTVTVCLITWNRIVCAPMTKRPRVPRGKCTTTSFPS